MKNLKELDSTDFEELQEEFVIIPNFSFLLQLHHLLDSNKWNSVCQNETIFKEMFYLDTSRLTNNNTVLQSKFCKDVLQKLDIAKLLQDLKNNTDFQQMFTLVSNFPDRYFYVYLFVDQFGLDYHG